MINEHAQRRLKFAFKRAYNTTPLNGPGHDYEHFIRDCETMFNAGAEAMLEITYGAVTSD